MLLVVLRIGMIEPKEVMFQPKRVTWMCLHHDTETTRWKTHKRQCFLFLLYHSRSEPLIHATILILKANNKVIAVEGFNWIPMKEPETRTRTKLIYHIHTRGESSSIFSGSHVEKKWRWYDSSSVRKCAKEELILKIFIFFNLVENVKLYKMDWKKISILV